MFMIKNDLNKKLKHYACDSTTKKCLIYFDSKAPFQINRQILFKN